MNDGLLPKSRVGPAPDAPAPPATPSGDFTRAWLAAIVDSSGDAIISKNLEGIITSWNAGAERLYGYCAREMIGGPITRLLPADRVAEEAAILDRIRRGERVEHFETVRVHKDGSPVEVSMTVSPIKAGSRIVGASKIARDITERKRAEERQKLMAEAGKLLGSSLDDEATLADVARLAVPVLADWCVIGLVRRDGSVERITGHHRDPAKSRRLAELLRPFPEHSPTAVACVAQIAASVHPKVDNEVDLTRFAATAPDPAYARALVELGLASYLSVPLAARGRTFGAISLCAARPHRYGPAEVRLAEDLARRTALALDNAHLYADLREADRRKDELLAMLGHELRNPLAPIRNSLRLLQTPGANPAEAAEAIAMMARQVEHVVHLLDDLLDVAKALRGKIELRQEVVDLADVCQRSVETAQPIVDARGHELMVRYPAEAVWVRGDVVRLTQVVSNLLTNAARYTDRPGQIWLQAAREGREAAVRVRDTGIGIRAEDLPRVFDLFVQANRPGGRGEGGLGLGLTLVKRITEMHGGTVCARSDGAGRGSEFIVRLPALEAASAPVATKPPARAVPTTRLRLLVVDDNVDAAESLAYVLRSEGHKVDTAYSGPAAVEAARLCRPDVAILDIGMPGMDGYETARRLRDEPAFAGMRLIALTGFGQQEDRRRAAEAGFDEHLVKPVDLDELQAVLALAAPACTDG